MSTTSFLISLLIPGEDLKFVKVATNAGFTEEFSEASTWSDSKDAVAYRDLLMDGFRKQGYRTTTASEEIGDAEDPASKVVMFTVLKYTLAAHLTTHLIKD